jgi:hypothetical protein
MHSQRLNSTSECTCFRTMGSVYEQQRSLPPSQITSDPAPSSFPNPFSAGIAYQTFTSVGGYWAFCWTSLLLSLILSTFSVDPDGYLCSSQLHVGWSCCLCSDVVFRSSGFGSECLEANAGAHWCSRVCPRIGSRVRSRDCTSVVSWVRSWDCTSDMVSWVRSRDCTSVVSRVRSRDGSHILCGAGFLHHSNGATRFAHQLHSLDLALWFTKLWIGASGHSRECFQRRHVMMSSDFSHHSEVSSRALWWDSTYCNAWGWLYFVTEGVVEFLQLTLQAWALWALPPRTLLPLQRRLRDPALCNPAGPAGTWRRVLELCSWDLLRFFSTDELRLVLLGVCRMCFLCTTQFCGKYFPANVEGYSSCWGLYSSRC